jgi:4-alpha-glucanotransferase
LSEKSYKELLDKLALSSGIEPAYQDNWRRIKRTSPKTQKSILQAMGLAVDSESELRQTWQTRQASSGRRMAEPTIIVTPAGLPDVLVIRVPCKEDGAGERGSEKAWEASLEVADEQGAVLHQLAFTMQEASRRETICAGGIAYDCWGLPFPRLPGLGYYTFHLSVNIQGEKRAESIFVAVCPEKAYIPPALEGEKRTAGLTVSLYAIRSARNWGIGDFGDLRELVDWVVDDLHGNVLGLNPLHAIFNRSPYNTSPYLPMSRFYRNFIYLDVPALPEYGDSPEAQELVNGSSAQRQLDDLRASPTVLYEDVAALKERVLRSVFESFMTNHWNGSTNETGRKKAFDDYVQSEGDLLDNFATFCSLDSVMRSRFPNAWTWSAWPEPYRRPDTEAVEDFRAEHWREILFHKWVQWQIEQQLSAVQDHARNRGMKIGLYHDLALAADRFSADVWANPDCFFQGLRLGAPPDAFAQAGQDWGVCPPNMEVLRETGYRLFIKEIRKNCSFGGALRIDHVMRFFHLFCVPENHLPTEGAYLSQPFEDLLRLLSLESLRNEVLMIGEDLGTVSGNMRQRLGATNVLSYRLLYFERDKQDGFLLPRDYPELALVTIATHDLPTLAGFWSLRDVEVRREAGMFPSHEAEQNAVSERETDKQRLLSCLRDLDLLPDGFHGGEKDHGEISGGMHHAVVSFMAQTPSKIFMLTLEDLVKEREQQNLPGSTVEYPNWSLKMKYSVEQLRSDPLAQAFCNMFRVVVNRYGRNESP